MTKAEWIEIVAIIGIGVEMERFYKYSNNAMNGISTFKTNFVNSYV